MSYINTNNPRRMIWFNQNAPKNKMDLWLSYNKHYEDTSNDETTDPQEITDNPSQRHCDLILKAWDCGQWIPIVGFNTTAANKIDIVTGVDYTIDGVTHSGKEVYHPAIFTAESPNELYDAGTLGELLKDTHFVTEGDWNDIYNEYIKTIIEQYPFDLWPAEQNELGGIWADRFLSTHIDSTAANKTWMAQCKYKYNASSNYNLYIHAKDIISAVNTYTTDNPSAPGIQPGGDFELWLADTVRIGGIKAAQDPNTADDCRNIPIVLAGPNVGSVWGLPFGSGTYPGDTDNETEYLYLPGWALLEWMKNPYFNQQEPQPFITGWKGVDTQLRENSDLIWVGLSGVTPENTGKLCTVQLNNTDPSGATIDWVDLVLNTLTDVNIQNPANNQILIYNSTTGKWENSNSQQQSIDFATDIQCGGIYADQFNYSPAYWAEAKFAPTGSSAWRPYEHKLIVDLGSVTYKDGNLISINQNNQINIDASNSQNGNVIISDSGVAKWGAVPNPTFGSTQISSGGFVTINGLRISTTTFFIINGQPYQGTDYDLNTWNYYTLENAKSIAITNTQTQPEPLYIRVISAPATQAFSCAGDIIDAQSVLSDTYEKDILITMQFGIAKFEEINTQSSTPAISEQS